MTDPKPRSSFLPILLLGVGVVVCAGVVLTFVPMVECEQCLGLGSFTRREFHTISYEEFVAMGYLYEAPKVDPTGHRKAYFDEVVETCNWCSGTARISIFKKYALDDPDGADSWVDVYQRIRELRESTP